MAHKNPVVVSADGKKHETLGDGNTLAPGSIPISSESGNGLSVKSDGLFSTSGGGVLLPAIPGTTIDAATSISEVRAAMLSLLQNPAVEVTNIRWGHVTYPNYPGEIGVVCITVIPADSGKYIFFSGDIDFPNQAAVNVYWADDSGDSQTGLLASSRAKIFTDLSLDGDGLTKLLGVKLSEKSGNGLSLRDDGLFVTAGGGGSVGYGEPTIITDPTDLGVVEAKYNDLLNDKTITKGVAYHYAQVTSGGEAVEYAGQGVMLSAVPAGDGVIATYAGVMAGSNKQMLRIRYSDGTNTALLVENTQERTLNTDATLTGNGDVSSALGVQVSADSQNELTVLQPENSDTPGLFARPISAMLFASDDSINKTSNYQGNPKNAAINVRVSSRENNALKLIPNSESSSERGLYVPPAQSLKRSTGGGNFSFGYPDNKSAKNACGKMGTGVYWKVTISLDNAGAGNVAVVPRIWTNNIPCMEDGTLVPYQIVTDYVTSNNNAVPSVAVWLICMGVPTHLMSITDGTLKKLQRGDNGLTNGLDDLYPLAPEGEFAQEPQWRREYFYTA